MGKTKSKKASGAGAGEESGSSPQAYGANELHERIWSVVFFEGVVGEGLTYEEARDLLASLEEKKTPGLCIVTNAAAERMRG